MYLFPQMAIFEVVALAIKSLSGTYITVKKANHQALVLQDDYSLIFYFVEIC